MVDFISGLFIELSLFAGIILLALSSSKKFKNHKSKMLIAGAVLIVFGLIFLDTAALSEAYQSGQEWGKDN